MDLEQRNIGPYRLLEPLGRGGMGVVYRAVHADGRFVALKTVRLAAENQLAGLRREIQALARLRHPGIVRILDEGVSDGLPWYAMELLEGVTLERYAWHGGSSPKRMLGSDSKTGPTQGEDGVPAQWWTETLDSEAAAQTPSNTRSEAVPRDFPDVAQVAVRGAGPGRESEIPALLRTRLSLVRRLCVPLAYLHGEGLVHRDLKATNVLVRPNGMPVLVDFGLAAQFGGDVSREALTAAGFTAGTVNGMAPEQIRGELVDARADLYALGCILYELLTGRPPFVSELPVEVLWQHLHAEPELPSTLAPDVPEPVEALVLQLLAKDPRQRLGHPDDVAAALGRMGVPDEPAVGSDAQVVLPRPRAILYRPGLSGRHDALSELDGHLQRLTSGQGSLLLVGGESGIGKTRLLLELARSAERRQIRVLSGECMQVDTTSGGSTVRIGYALQPLRKALRAIADRCREKGRDETERLLGRRGKVLALYEPALCDLPGQECYADAAELPAVAARARLFGDLAETLRILAEDQPVLLLLDDLQWADELTLQFLGFVARSSSTPTGAVRVTIVGSYRSEELGDSLRALTELPRVWNLRLGRLEEDAVGQMVCDMLGLPESPAAFSRYLSGQSEGNPFFVAEYLRTAVREGLLWRDEAGRWQVAAEAEEDTAEEHYSRLPLPQSVRELVARRLNRLGAPARRLVDAAAVLGKGVESAVLAAVSSLGPTELLEGTLELLGQQVMEDVGRGGLRFVHDKLREVAYDHLGEAHRIELHRAAAEALDALRAERRDEVLATLGHHWERAGESDKARDCYLPAAEKAALRYAFIEAERLYRAYLGFATHPTIENIKARAQLGDLILRNQGRAAEAIEQFQKALDDALHLGDLALASTYLGSLAKLHLELGKSKEAFALSDLALSIAQSLGSPWHEAYVQSVRAFLLFENGDLEEALQFYSRALPTFRDLGDRAQEALVSGNLAAVHGVQGRHEESRALLERTLDIAREARRPQVEANALINLGLLHLDEGRHQEALTFLEKSLALSRELGDRRAEGMTLGRLAKIHRQLGEMDEAMSTLHKALAFHREVENSPHEGFSLLSIAGIERECRGASQEAQRTLEAAEAILGKIGSTREWAHCICERGHLTLAASRPAREFLDKAKELASALKAEPGGWLGQDIAKLQRAVDAFEAGRHDGMFHGELIEDLPEGVRRWLVRNEQISSERAKLTT